MGTILKAALIIFFLVAPLAPAFSLTLEEALSLAQKKLPFYKSAQFKVNSSEALYKASLSPYFPSLDVSASETFSQNSDYNRSTSYGADLSYTIYDFGKRKANRDISRAQLKFDTDNLGKTQLDLEYLTKTAYYTLVARKELLEQKTLQETFTKKDLEIASGRHKLGVEKLSDVLQASVRYEQARFDLRQAEGFYKNALHEFNSLLGRDFSHPFDLTSPLPETELVPERGLFMDLALKRPEVRQAEYNVMINEYNKDLVKSSFFPNINLGISYQKTRLDESITDTSFEDKTASITASWNIFELDKFYRKTSTEYDIKASMEDLSEIKRTILLEVQDAHENLITALDEILLAKEQLRQAKFNYEQALGEYKAGTGDILSLVLAENLLSQAHERHISARLSTALSMADLERSAGIKNLSELIKKYEKK